jgi:hypothetical protein
LLQTEDDDRDNKKRRDQLQHALAEKQEHGAFNLSPPACISCRSSQRRQRCSLRA